MDSCFLHNALFFRFSPGFMIRIYPAITKAVSFCYPVLSSDAVTASNYFPGLQSVRQLIYRLRILP